MLPLYAARIEDLGVGDLVKVDCAACHHVALLTPEALISVRLSPAAKVLDLKGRLRCCGCGRKGRAVVSVKWRGASRTAHLTRVQADAWPAGKERRRVGGALSTPLPVRLGPAGSDRQAGFDPTRQRSIRCHWGSPPAFGLSGASVSSHRSRVRKTSQRFVSLKAFNTEETNQRFRQSSANVPSSNQWIITQPTPRLLRLLASEGIMATAVMMAVRPKWRMQSPPSSHQSQRSA
jgi:hypothetical protein